MEKMTLKQFYQILENFDWFYEFADDLRAEKAGAERFKEVGLIAFHNGPAYVDLMKAYRSYVWSGPAWGTVKKPKPELPK